MRHVRFIEDARGDLVDIELFCNALCFEAHTGEPHHGHGWPCPEQTDCDQHCASCGALVVPAINSEGETS